MLTGGVRFALAPAMFPLRMMITSCLMSCALSACGGHPTDGLSADAAQPSADAPERANADSSVVATCSSIAVGPTDLEPWRVSTIDWLRDLGHRGASGERQSGDRVSIRGFNAEIDSADLKASSVGWLLAIPGFPVQRSSEVEVAEFKQIRDNSATVVIKRAHVGAVPARLFRPLAVLQLGKSGQAWSVISVSVWASTALLSESTATSLAACSPTEPPPTDLIEKATFEGLTMSGCAIVGEYRYQPDSSDSVAFSDTLDWVVVDNKWRTRRGVTLTVATSNHWAEIGGSDCYCGGVAGFELYVDAVTGEVFEYRPGINCVVC